MRTIELNEWPSEPVLWYYATSFDSEWWTGKKASREAAMDAIRGDYATDPADEETGVVCWLVSGKLARPDFRPTPAALRALLSDYEDRNASCWTEDGCGADPDCPEDIDELVDLIANVMEHCISEPDSRMIAEFLTMEAVVRRDGQLVIDPTIVP